MYIGSKSRVRVLPVVRKNLSVNEGKHEKSHKKIKDENVIFHDKL